MNNRLWVWLGFILTGGGVIVILLLAVSLGTRSYFNGKSTRSWLRALKDDDKSVAEAARRELQAGGPEAVPILMEGLRDGSTWGFCTEVLRNMQPPPTSTLLIALEGKHPLVRAGAAAALANCRPEEKKMVAAALVEVLRDKSVEALKDKNIIVRRRTILSLSSIGPATDEVIPALLEILKSDDNEMQVAAAYALGCFGPKSKAAVPALVDLLKQRGTAVGDQAAEALKKIDSEVANKVGLQVESQEKEAGKGEK